MRHCCCGNPLGPSAYRVVTSPCRCEAPGRGRSTLTGAGSLPDGPFGVGPEQYRQRTRLGLPPVTEVERSYHREMEGI